MGLRALSFQHFLMVTSVYRLSFLEKMVCNETVQCSFYSAVKVLARQLTDRFGRNMIC